MPGARMPSSLVSRINMSGALYAARWCRATVKTRRRGVREKGRGGDWMTSEDVPRLSLSPHLRTPRTTGASMSSDSPIVLTREQVRRVDQIAIERFRIPGIVLMENAARGVIDAIRAERLACQSVLVLCGGGNNGGDGLAVARHLHIAGSHVTIGLC